MISGLPRSVLDSVDSALLISRSGDAGLPGGQVCSDVRDSATLWSPPPDEVTLGRRDVHVWRASLEPEPPMVSRMQQLLSADERARAERFYFEIDRRRFIVARGCLRTILSRYAGIASAEIRFDYTAHGKPMLADSIPQVRGLEFNLAHSAGLGLFAFTRVGNIGVDLERIQPEFTGDAGRFFSPTEQASLTRIPAPARNEAFFNCWTRKEAFVKAKGKGLSIALDQFDVTLNPDEPAALLRTRWHEGEALGWSLKAIDAGPGYAGALAVQARNWRLSCWQIDEEFLSRGWC